VSADDSIDKLEQVWGAVSAVGHTLSEEQWSAPTDCPGWDVKDHVSHMIGTERMLEGLPTAPASDADGDHVKNPIGQFNENELDSRRAMSGAEVLAEFDELVATRLASLRGGDEAYFARETMTPTGPGTMADFLHIRVMDCYVHEQDIRRAVDQPGDLDAPAAAHSVDRLLRTIGIVVGKRAGVPEGASVLVELTGPVQRTVPVTVRDGRAKLVDTVPDDLLATVRMDSEAFLILATGRRTATDLAGRWTVEGDDATGGAIVEQLNMMI
jgi:uncharacterized protein (TIGR03083 family)